jgi:hypothetical protein
VTRGAVAPHVAQRPGEVGKLEDRDARLSAVALSLGEWRQGDCVIGDGCTFLFRYDPTLPVSPDPDLSPEFDIGEQPVEGLVVLTQSCDIVRDCVEKPTLEVAALVRVDEREYAALRHSSRFAIVPGLQDKLLVADLERVMTVEKPVVAGWTRVEGCVTDEDRRLFAQAIVRKRQRFAFPDDFAHRAGRMRSRFRDKHDKSTDEGRALSALLEIRVRAEPGWDDERIKLTFFFIKKDGVAGVDGLPWPSLAADWTGLFDTGGQFVEVDPDVTTLDDISARDYFESDRLDLDQLSTPRARARNK